MKLFPMENCVGRSQKECSRSDSSLMRLCGCKLQNRDGSQDVLHSLNHQGHTSRFDIRDEISQGPCSLES